MSISKGDDRVLIIARQMEELSAVMLINPNVRANLASGAFLLRELARYDGTTFDTPRLMHAINNVRNDQA